jgi:aryl-alcohol dehydrogenase-like predicted oxidoreductase
MVPDRYDLTKPGNQRKLEAADALAGVADDAGMILVTMAVAWVLEHPTVTAAIIGPRTMEQLTTQLDAGTTTLDATTLDRIDEIVPPGKNFSWADAGYAPPGIAAPEQRRRPRA